MKTAKDAVKAACRLHILKALALRTKYRAEPRGLRDELEVTGYPMDLTKLAVECAFLANLGLVDAPESGVLSLTDDGLSVAKGLVKLPGIGTPEPGEL